MADKTEKKQLGKWQCNFCDDTEGVVNGVCPTCGPTQTTPLDDKAKDIAGVAEAEALKTPEIQDAEVVEESKK